MAADADESDDDVVSISSDDDDEAGGVVEEVDHVKTVSEVAEEENISDLFDPRVLGGWSYLHYFVSVLCM